MNSETKQLHMIQSHKTAVIGVQGIHRLRRRRIGDENERWTTATFSGGC